MTTKNANLAAVEDKSNAEISEKKQWLAPDYEKIEVKIKLPVFLDPDDTGSA